MSLKNAVIRAERRILSTLGFVVHVHHPHKLIYVFLHVLKLLKDDEDNEMLQKAWNYMNDGLRTDMFLRYKPETIACACIHLAARTLSSPIPLPKHPFPWFELFDVSDRDIDAACSMLMELYSRKKRADFFKLTQELNILYDRIYLQIAKPEVIGIQNIPSTVKKVEPPRKLDPKLEKLLSKHNEIPLDTASNGRTTEREREREPSLQSSQEHREREDRRRRSRSRSRHRDRDRDDNRKHYDNKRTDRDRRERGRDHGESRRDRERLDDRRKRY